MRIPQKIHFEFSPLAALRFGIGMTLLYAGLSMFFDTTSWKSSVPGVFADVLPPEIALAFAGIFSIILAFFFFLGVFLRITAFAAFLWFAIGLVLSGVTESTFRDFGLMCASLAAFFLAEKTVKKTG